MESMRFYLFRHDDTNNNVMWRPAFEDIGKALRVFKSKKTDLKCMDRPFWKPFLTPQMLSSDHVFFNSSNQYSQVGMLTIYHPVNIAMEHHPSI